MKKGKKYENNIKAKASNMFANLDDDITLQNFLDQAKEKWKKKSQEITIQVKENNETIVKPSAKRYFLSSVVGMYLPSLPKLLTIFGK